MHRAKSRNATVTADSEVPTRIPTLPSAIPAASRAVATSRPPAVRGQQHRVAADAAGAHVSKVFANTVLVWIPPVSDTGRPFR